MNTDHIDSGYPQECEQCGKKRPLRFAERCCGMILCDECDASHNDDDCRMICMSCYGLATPKSMNAEHICYYCRNQNERIK